MSAEGDLAKRRNSPREAIERAVNDNVWERVSGIYCEQYRAGKVTEPGDAFASELRMRRGGS